MKGFCQGDIVKISSYGKELFVIVSKNAFIKAAGVFHVCLLREGIPEGPLHIRVSGKNNTSGTVICEQLKLIDPTVRTCSRIDRLPYEQLMDISDAVQGIFEYD